MSIAANLLSQSASIIHRSQSFTPLYAVVLRSGTIFRRDALRYFEAPFLGSLGSLSLFQQVSFPNYMPMNFLTLFAAMTYAAPVVPQGEMLEHRCSMVECRNGVSVGGCLYKRVVFLTPEFCRPPRVRRIQVPLMVLRC